MTHVAATLGSCQQASLSPRLQQSVSMLRMSTDECHQRIQEIMEGNPFLAHKDELSEESPVIPDAVGETNRGRMAFGERNRAAQDISQWARHEIGLRDMLRVDLALCRLAHRDQLLAEHVIDALDEDGYLRTAFQDLAAPGVFHPPAESVEWETALIRVQNLGITGLAARDLAECLSLQLRAMPADTEQRGLALRMVSNHLPDLAQHDTGRLARELHAHPGHVRQAMLLIQTLNPRPGACFAMLDPDTHIVPDAVVHHTEKGWRVTTPCAAMEHIALNRPYVGMSRGATSPPLTEALREARWLLHSLAQRQDTIRRVARAIVARQQLFFDYGGVALRPMLLSELARELDVHESTLSRAVHHKYMASPRGIHEFRSFFSNSLTTRSGGTCSSAAVRALIRDLIESEPPDSPLSDVELGARLAAEGIVVARRTVSKYRARLGYPPVGRRKC